MHADDGHLQYVDGIGSMLANDERAREMGLLKFSELLRLNVSVGDRQVKIALQVVDEYAQTIIHLEAEVAVGGAPTSQLKAANRA